MTHSPHSVVNKQHSLHCQCIYIASLPWRESTVGNAWYEWQQLGKYRLDQCNYHVAGGIKMTDNRWWNASRQHIASVLSTLNGQLTSRVVYCVQVRKYKNAC